jgi:hypothetical protein
METHPAFGRAESLLAAAGAPARTKLLVAVLAALKFAIWTARLLFDVGLSRRF